MGSETNRNHNRQQGYFDIYLEKEPEGYTIFMTEEAIYWKTLNAVQRQLEDIEQITDKAEVLYIEEITRKYIGSSF